MHFAVCVFQNTNLQYKKYVGLYVLLCIHKCMGVNKVWCIHFGRGRVHKAFRFALYEFNIYMNKSSLEGKE
jgi:hypothetical protein